MTGMRQTVLLELRYRGRDFHGVQPQPGWTTVGDTVRQRLELACGAPPRGLACSARTDTGVDAEQNFATAWFRDVHALAPRLHGLREMNDVALQITGAWLVPRSLHARNAALGKHYRYRIEHGIPRSELEKSPQTPGSWRVVPRLDATRMRRATVHLLGSHDYSAFRANGCSAKNPVKTLARIDVTESGSQIDVDVEGDAFLRRMVRILVGTLAEVGAGLRSPEALLALLAGKDRKPSGVTAPADGLCLRAVKLAWPEPTQLEKLWP